MSKGSEYTSFPNKYMQIANKYMKNHGKTSVKVTT